MARTVSFGISLTLYDCVTCGGPVVLSDGMERSLRDSHGTFYCPLGHAQSFKSESEAEKLKRQLAERERQLAERDRQLVASRASRDQLEAELTSKARAHDRLKKRVKSGVCPCCKRTVKQMAAHMKSKHPEYAA